jgi:tetratricopeptide (TPR) repeat protein
VRDPEALKKLSEVEQRRWRTFWYGVEVLRFRGVPWRHVRLGEALHAEGKRDLALAEFRKAVELAPEDPVAWYQMGLVMRASGVVEQALELFGRAAELDREHNTIVGDAIWRRGELLRELGRYDEAIETYWNVAKFPQATPDDIRRSGVEQIITEAHRRSAAARANAQAGCGLASQNPPPDDRGKAKLRADAFNWFNKELAGFATAIASGAGENAPEIVEAVKHWKVAPDLAGVRGDDALRKLPEAEQKRWRFFWLAVDDVQNNNQCWMHIRLSELLDAEGKRDEAAAEFRKAVQAIPNDGWCCWVGVEARNLGYMDLAVELLTRARNWDVLHWSNPGDAIWELGRTLRLAGRFNESVAVFRRIREMNKVSAKEVRLADEEILRTEGDRSLLRRLTEILKGKQVVGAVEAEALAGFASNRSLHTAATRLWKLALDADPKMGDDRQASPRYDAARTAALAGCGLGNDVPAPDAAAMGKLRAQALEWLKTELGIRAATIGSKSADERVPVVRVFEYWMVDPDLAGVRDPEAIAKLPETERQAWTAFWSGVDSAIKTASAK